MTRAVPEWIGKTPDTPIPPRVKVRIFERDGKRCQECTRLVGAGRLPFAFDHIRALVNGGEHRETNLQLLCEHCHKIKTGEDVAEKKIVARKKVKHLGLKPKSALSKRDGMKFNWAKGRYEKDARE